MTVKMDNILSSYGFDEKDTVIHSFGNGLINHTWVVENGSKFILQKINGSVFKHPEDIAFNIALIDDYLQKHEPAYYFTSPVKTKNNQAQLYIHGDGYYRMFPFVKNSHSKDVVATAAEAYEAARQFGRFTQKLDGFDSSKLKITLPSFHDITLRYQQFLMAIQRGNQDKVRQAGALLATINSFSYIIQVYENIKINPAFKLRVTHHDTKISNVLFNTADKGICVIDLDTVMPGYFISDVGDMMRTYLSPVSEEEPDFSKIEIRADFYKAIVSGYKEEMDAILTDTEKQHFFYAGTFIIYMQALRFITDHFNDDVYYGAKYEGHNYIRAQNQITLLQRLVEYQGELEKYR